METKKWLVLYDEEYKENERLHPDMQRDRRTSTYMAKWEDRMRVELYMSGYEYNKTMDGPDVHYCTIVFPPPGPSTHHTSSTPSTPSYDILLVEDNRMPVIFLEEYKATHEYGIIKSRYLDMSEHEDLLMEATPPWLIKKIDTAKDKYNGSVVTIRIKEDVDVLLKLSKEELQELYKTTTDKKEKERIKIAILSLTN